jgi:methyltransferase of ATP-grasp peptide maturase system
VTDDWVRLAHGLAAELAAEGTARTPAWRAAVEAVPRHEFVPHYFTQDETGRWHRVSVHDPDWLHTVYSNTTLITALSGPGEPQFVVSSSTQPGLMVRMLEALGIMPGHRVLEIGTGTGYNAALLCHYLGDGSVYSIDIEANLVDRARDRLATLGYHPTLITGDGARGVPEHSPYDRILATCSVPAVPSAWAAQTTDGALVLVDVKIGPNLGTLALLRKSGHLLQGRFLPQWAGFMPLRSPGATPAGRPRAGRVVEGTTTIDPQPWNNLVVWFLARFHQPGGLTFGYTLDEHTRRPTATFLTSADGSWCEIEHEAHAGIRQVRQAGPHRLWDAVETAQQLWNDAGRPGWDRFGLTVGPDRQCVWLDDPGSAHGWDLPRAG